MLHLPSPLPRSPARLACALALLALAGASRAERAPVPTPNQPDAPSLAAPCAAAPGFEIAEDGAWVARRTLDGFEARVTARGVAIAPVDSAVDAWSLSLDTQALGRGDAVFAVASGEVAPDGASVVLRRSPTLVEWLVHAERGIEQGWTLAAPPSGSGEIVVRIALETDLTPRLAADAQAVYLHDWRGKPVLRYGELAAFDAGGRALPARLALALGAIEVRVDDAGAAYPVTIDPLIAPAAWQIDGNQAGGFFGFGVSAAGDVNGDGFSDLLIGSTRFDNGALVDAGGAVLFYGSPSGLSVSPDWTLLGTQAGALLGEYVTTAGDVDADGFDDFLVSEHLWDGDLTDEGRVRLFRGSPTGPVATAWAPEGNQSGAQFGAAVGWAGDVNGDGFDDVIVGARYYDAGSTDEGRAFVYLGTPAGLSVAPVWIKEPDQASALFGFSVASAGDTNADGYDDIVIGAPYYNNGASTDAGAVGVYLGGPFGPAAAPVYWGTVSQAYVRTGYSVAPAGDVNADGYADVAMGGPWYDGGQADEGIVWVKTGSSAGITGSGWIEEGDATSIGWGYGVSTAGDVNGDGFADLIGSAVYWESSAGTPDEGAVWLYLGSKTGLPSTSQQLVAQGNQSNAYLGHRVGAAGDVNGDGYSDVYVATGYFDDPEADEGKVWVYYGSPDGVQLGAPWVVESNFTNARHGETVEMAGDVDGDGFDDLLVAAGGHPNAFANGGRVYLYEGRAGGIATSAAWLVDAAQAGEMLGAGQGLAAAGDVNGDGYADVIVGGMGFDGAAGVDAGRARLYLGGANGLAAAPAWTFEGSAAGELVGGAVAGVGDVDGDGLADVLVGAEGFGSGVGRAYLFRGSGSGLTAQPSRTFDSPHATVSTPPGFASNLAGAGDVDGDGYSDFLVSAPHNGSGQRVYLYRGDRHSISTVPAWTYENFEWGLQPHWTIVGSGVGDVNGDGFGDVAIGAELEDFQAGHAYLFLGSSGGLAATPAWEMAGTANARLGRCVASAGDVNADGMPDFAIGAPYETVDQNAEGALHVRYGSVASPGASGYARTSTLASAGFGWSGSGDGDLDGDGFSDLAVGSPLVDNPSLDEGRAFVSYGNDGRSRARRLQQRRHLGGVPVAALGGVGLPSFRLALDAFSPAGRGDVSLEWELEPATRAFDGAGVERSALSIDTGVPSGGQSMAEIDELASLLAWLRLYDWRVRVTSDHPLFPRSPWFSLAKAKCGDGALRAVPRKIGYQSR